MDPTRRSSGLEGAQKGTSDALLNGIPMTTERLWPCQAIQITIGNGDRNPGRSIQ